MVTSKDKYTELTALFKAGLSGDAKRYQQFLWSITPIIRAVVSRKIAQCDAEDVVQEILISVHKSSHTYDGERPLMPWLMAIVQFRITDHLRKLYAMSQHKTVNIDELSEILTGNVTIAASENESVEGLLEGSTEREKKILTLMHVEGYTARETGQQLGMKESAVKVAAHRAVKKIRERWGS